MSQVAACWSWEGPDLPRMECISPRVPLSAAPAPFPTAQPTSKLTQLIKQEDQ